MRRLFTAIIASIAGVGLLGCDQAARPTGYVEPGRITTLHLPPDCAVIKSVSVDDHGWPSIHYLTPSGEDRLVWYTSTGAPTRRYNLVRSGAEK
jgi:hypothetical protein